MGNKRRIILLFSILTIIFIIIISNSIYKENYKNKLVNEIESKISNGNYNEAIRLIDEGNYDEKLITYKQIIEDFFKIKEEPDLHKAKDNIDIFKEKYSNYLNNNVFSKLNEDILKVEKNINSYYNEINEAKENILSVIEKDIYSAEELINEFKEKYPKEDISDIEIKYNKKLDEMKKEEEENKQEEEPEVIEKEENNANNGYASLLGIENTTAATRSSQLITVVSKGGSYGELVFWEKDSSGKWILIDRVAARLGQNGMKSASEVYEMDKSTPTGIYSLTEAFGINEDPGSKIRYRKLEGTEYWVDDVNSEYYNTMQFGESNGRWSSAEKLIDYEGYYNYSLVIDYNRWPVIPGKSSAIFLHCDIGTYTYGCVAIPQENLANIITRLDPEKDPFIIIDFSYEDIYTKY